MNLPTPEQAQQRICDVLESLAKQYEVPLAHLSKTFELSPIEENAPMFGTLDKSSCD